MICARLNVPAGGLCACRRRCPRAARARHHRTCCWAWAAALLAVSGPSLRADEPVAAPQRDERSAADERAGERPSIPDDLSAQRCLSQAETLIDRDEYGEARHWYEAARDRAGAEPLRARAVFRLKTLPILGRPAVEPILEEWFSEARPSLERARGRVVAMLFIQPNQPESIHAAVELDALAVRLGPRGLSAMAVAVRLDASAANTPEEIRRDLAAQRLSMPMGLDAKDNRTFERYGFAGTPSVALIDRAGRVRRVYEYDSGAVERTIAKLLGEGPDHRLPGPRRSVPASREGHGIVGRKAPRLQTRDWMNTPDGGPPELVGVPRLIRFWMADCAYCTATAPALNALHREYGERGLRVIGVFHPKPAPRHVPFDQVRLTANRLELTFPITADNDWAYLRKIWLNGPQREYTSAAFLIDRKGVIRYVHPGPDFHASADPAKSRQNRDYLELRAAIEAVLDE